MREQQKPAPHGDGLLLSDIGECAVMAKLKIVVLLVACFLLSIVFVGCGDNDSKTTVGNANNTALRVATSIDFPPFEFSSERHKGYQGFDMDLIRAIGEEMGRDVVIEAYDFDKLLSVLQTKQADVIIAALSISEERRKVVRFSKPYYHSGLSLVVRYDNQNIRSFTDLRGKRVAVQSGSTAIDELKKIGDVTIKEFTNQPDIFMELSIGGVDAIVNDRPVNDFYIHNYGMAGVKSLDDMLTREEYGIAVRKDNVELMQQIDAALKKLHTNGKYAQIYTKWFGK